MLRLADAGILTATCDAGILTIDNRSSDGKGYTRPERDRADLARYDIRLSVSAGDGRFANFLLERYETVRRDNVGPVLDMFAGRLAAKAGEFVLFTDTYLRALPESLAGQVPLEINRWPIATMTLPGGKTGSFIVDIGAGSTVVARSFLPKGTRIEKSGMTQYSSAGRQTLKYAPGGATGQVQNVLGHAVLPEIQLGDLRVKQFTVDVMSRMPDIFRRPIDGILGLDLLRQTRVLSFDFAQGSKPKATMRLMRSAKTGTTPFIEMPFTFVNSHLVVSGQIGGQPVHFVLDTGAPRSILDVSAAKRVGLRFDKFGQNAGVEKEAHRSISRDGSLVRSSTDMARTVLGSDARKRSVSKGRYKRTFTTPTRCPDALSESTVSWTASAPEPMMTITCSASGAPW